MSVLKYFNKTNVFAALFIVHSGFNSVSAEAPEQSACPLAAEIVCFSAEGEDCGQTGDTAPDGYLFQSTLYIERLSTQQGTEISSGDPYSPLNIFYFYSSRAQSSFSENGSQKVWTSVHDTLASGPQATDLLLSDSTFSIVEFKTATDVNFHSVTQNLGGAEGKTMDTYIIVRDEATGEVYFEGEQPNKEAELSFQVSVTAGQQLIIETSHQTEALPALFSRSDLSITAVCD